MSAVLNLLLLSAATLLVSVQGWNNYRNLPETYKTHIDKALQEANNRFGGPHHVAFEQLKSDPIFKEESFHVHVLLKVTDCKKDQNIGFGNRDECVTRKPKTPLIDCVVCKGDQGEELTDCAILANANNREIRNKCSVYLPGSAVLGVLTTEDNDREFGCLGCV